MSILIRGDETLTSGKLWLSLAPVEGGRNFRIDWLDDHFWEDCWAIPIEVDITKHGSETRSEHGGQMIT